VCFFCKSQEEFKAFYSEENDLVYCNNVCGVMDVLDHEHKTSEWRLFIACSKTSFCTMGTNLLTVTLAYTSNMKERYENLKILLEKFSMTNIVGPMLLLRSDCVFNGFEARLY
jgi:hypothetical protein